MAENTENWTKLESDSRYPRKYQFEELQMEVAGVVSGFQGTIVIADTPTTDGIYRPTEEGTYPNAGGLSYLPSTTDEGFQVEFILNGGVWSKSRVDVSMKPIGVVEEGNEFAVSGGEVFDKVLTKEVFLYFQTGKNKYNKEDNADGTITINGEWQYSVSQMTSGFIPVKGGQQYTLGYGPVNPNSQRLILFGSEDNNDIIQSYVGQNVFDFPQDGYIKFNTVTTAQDYREVLQFEEGSEVTTYEPYTLSPMMKEEYLPESTPIEKNGKVEEGDESLVVGGEVFEKTLTKEVYLNTQVIEGKNLFDKNESEEGIITINGEWQYSVSQMTSGFIPVKGGQQYIASGGFSSANSNRFLLLGSKNNEDIIAFYNGLGAFTPIQDGYIKTNVKTTTSDFRETLQLEKGTEATSYAPYVEPIVVQKMKEEYLPEIPSSGDTELSDKRFIQSFNMEQDDYQKNKQFYDSLRKLRGSAKPDFSKTIYISNPFGVALKNVVIPIHVSWNTGTDSEEGRHVFMDENVEPDFSDLRAFTGAEMLDMTIVSQGKYSMFPAPSNYNYEDVVKIDDTYVTGLGIYSSTDLESFTQLIPDHIFAFADIDGNIYAKPSSGDPDLIKFYKSTNYATSKVVITAPTSSAVWRVKNYDYDSQGNIYIGAYQNEFLARVYKSTDMGETWNVVLGEDVVKSQHVHNLVVDRSVTPNKIYVSFDGNMNSNNGTEPSQYTSVDYGATWQKEDVESKLGHRVDSWVMYANSGNLLGGSEGAIKYSPSIYSSRNNGQTYSIGLWGQNTHTAFKLGDMYFMVGTNYQPFKESTIYASYDLTKWFKVYQNVGIFNSGFGTGDGYRYGSYGEIEDVDGTPCSIMTSRNTNMPRLKLKVGEIYSSALVYVMMKDFPAGGKTIRFENNYTVSEPNRNLFYSDIEPLLRYPLNERVSALDYVQLSANPKWKLNLMHYGHNVQDVMNVPFKNQGLVRNSDFNIEETFNSVNQISVSFWYSYADKNIANTSIGLLEIGDIRLEHTSLKRQLSVKVGLASQTVANAFRVDSSEQPSLFTATINKSTGNIKIYLNEYLVDTINLDLSAINLNSLKAGNAVASSNHDLYISDLRVYNSELKHDEVNLLFWKANIL